MKKSRQEGIPDGSFKDISWIPDGFLNSSLGKTIQRCLLFYSAITGIYFRGYRLIAIRPAGGR
jgi:hypothetical protein